MKIIIEITSAETAQLIDHFHLQDTPCILSEIHEDFEEAIPAQPKPEKKPKAKKGKGGRPRKKAVEEKEPAGDEPETCPEMAASHSRAFEPFRPSYTMDDVLKREEEIREASLAAYHEKARQSRDRLRSVKKDDSEWKRINSDATSWT